MQNAVMQLSPRATGIVYAAVTLAIWASFVVIARAMSHKTLTPFDITFVRILGASVVAVPWGIWWVRRNPGAPNWLGVSPLSCKVTATLGLLGAVIYPVVAYTGFFFAPAAHAAVLMPGFLPLWTALLALFVIGTPIPARRRIGLALIVCGGLLVGGASLLKAFEGGTVWFGDILFLCGSFLWSCYTITLRKNGAAAIPATIAITVFALLTFVPVYGALAWSGLVASKISVAPWSEIFLQAFMQGILSVIVSGITFVKMVEHYGPVRTTMITAITPAWRRWER
jgi:drug/metabolite transporter (DMT)-like permease